jgi:glutathione peroxidase
MTVDSAGLMDVDKNGLRRRVTGISFCIACHVRWRRLRIDIHKQELADMSSVYDFTVRDIDGNERSLGEWRGKTLLIVNVASKCGFTPQYKGLENLWQDQRDKGLVILGFPCDQFGHQEPGDADEIKTFCSTRYDVTFPMFSKVEVNGDHADPLYQWLKSEGKGILGSESVKWNFTKFLVDENGQVVKRYAPTGTPEKIGKDTLTRLDG